MTNRIPTVMVVDDESAIRTLMADVLRMSGYQPAIAKHAVEAMDICGEEAGPPDLLITDVMMPPYLNGVELVRKLRVRKPDMRVIYVSGFAAEEVFAEAFKDPQADFLPKPLSPLTLSQRVEKIMDGTPCAAARDAIRKQGTFLLSITNEPRRKIIREALKESGAWVLEALHQAEAQFMAQWHESPIHVLVTERPKPMAGRAPWYNRMKTLRPGLRIFFLETGESGLTLVPESSEHEPLELWDKIRANLERSFHLMPA